MYVVARRIRLASVDWTNAPDLLSAQSIVISIDTWSLLSGVLLIEDFQAESVQVNLAANPDGEANWDFAVSDSEDSGTTPANGTGLSVLLNQAHVSDLKLTYDSPAAVPLEFVSSSIELQESDSGGLGFQIEGVLNETEVTASGSVRQFDDIVDRRNVDFDLTGAIGEIDIKGTGHIDDLLEPLVPELEFTVQGPSAEYLTEVLNIEPITTGPLEFKVAIGPEDGATSAHIEGTYGEFDVRLDARFRDLQNFDDLNVTLRTSGPSIATVARVVGRADFPQLPFLVDASASLSGETLIVERFSIVVGVATFEANAKLPQFPGFGSAQVSVNTRGPEFGSFNRLL